MLRDFNIQGPIDASKAFVAGGLAGCISKTVVAPAERIKERYVPYKHPNES